METVPVKRLVFSEVEGESGVKTIAFVDMPAIMVNWIAFNDQQEVKFTVQDEDKRIILSPALIPDLHIPRINPATKEPFAVVMDRETIFEVAYRWQKEGRQNLANEMHDSGKPIEGVTWMFSFVSDEKYIPNPQPFEKLPFGTWYLMGKVNNDEVWADVKSGKYKGISVEGFFDLLAAQSLTIEEIEAIAENIL